VRRGQVAHYAVAERPSQATLETAHNALYVPDVPNMRAHSGPARWGPMAIAAEPIAPEPIATERFPARREPTISPSGELGSGCVRPRGRPLKLLSPRAERSPRGQRASRTGSRASTVSAARNLLFQSLDEVPKLSF